MSEEMKDTEEVFKKKKTVDKMKIAQKIFAVLVIFLMVFSVCGTLIYYLLNSNS